MLVELGSKFSSDKNFNNIDYYLNNLKELISKNNNIKDNILPKRENYENTNQNILSAEEISFSYDKKTNVLDNINLSIKKNELTAILGANGSGKSTLSLVLSRALKPTKGKVIKDENTKIGYIFQEPSYQILSTSVKEAFCIPYLILASILSLNIIVSCVTRPIISLNDLSEWAAIF